MPLFASGPKSKLESDQSEIDMNVVIGLPGAGRGVGAGGIPRRVSLLVPTGEMNLSGDSRRNYYFWDPREGNTHRGLLQRGLCLALNTLQWPQKQSPECLYANQQSSSHSRSNLRNVHSPSKTQFRMPTSEDPSSLPPSRPLPLWGWDPCVPAHS